MRLIHGLSWFQRATRLIFLSRMELLYPWERFGVWEYETSCLAIRYDRWRLEVRLAQVGIVFHLGQQHQQYSNCASDTSPFEECLTSFQSCLT